jgi:DNA-directed RNA polymerase specialized sigma24 family protein
MPQAPYGDAESLFRAAHNELMRVAYALLGNHADTEDGCVSLIGMNIC